MYSVSQAFQEQVKSTDRKWVLRISIDTALGQHFDLADKDVVSSAFKYEGDALSGDTLAPGACVAGDYEVSIYNPNHLFDDIQLNGAVLYPEAGLELNDGSVEYVPFGKFTIDDVSRPTTTITLKAADDMVKFDQSFSNVGQTFPCTCLELLTAVCRVCGVELATTDFVNSDYSVTSAPDSTLTCRDIVSDVAELAGCFGRIRKSDKDRKSVV